MSRKAKKAPPRPPIPPAPRQPPNTKTVPTPEKASWYAAVPTWAIAALTTILLAVVATVVYAWLPAAWKNESPELTAEQIAATAQARAAAQVQDEPGRAIPVEPEYGTLTTGESGISDFQLMTNRVRNFSTEIEFYSPTYSDWVYGISFRSMQATGGEDGVVYNASIALWLDSDGIWSFGTVSNLSTYPDYSRTMLESGTSNHVSAGQKTSNTIKLVVVDYLTHLYINSYYTTTFDMRHADLYYAQYDFATSVYLFNSVSKNIAAGNSVKYHVWSLANLDPPCNEEDPAGMLGRWGDC